MVVVAFSRALRVAGNQNRNFHCRLSSTIGPNYEDFMSPVSAARQPSAIRRLQPFLKIPGMISLGGGMPNPCTFPFESFSMTLKNGERLELNPAQLEEALQYSATPGIGGLVDWLMELQVTEHKPPMGADSLSISVTNGSQDGLTKAFDVFLGGSESSLLVEDPTYSGALAYLAPKGVKLVGVPTDGDGIIPAQLKAVLDGWDTLRQGKKPKVLYTVPTGCNPTGATLSLERRHELYAIAIEHDLVIMEDDPYYYLQFGESRVPSLLSLDTQGRVLRFDSFSKILSSGLRLGFVTGPAPLVERINLHSQATTLHPSGLSQAVALSLLSGWGVSGFLSHVSSVVDFYSQQGSAFLAAADKHMSELATWTPPTAGMFLWMKLNRVTDSFPLIENGAKEKKVLLVPGTVFLPTGGPSPYVRAAFSSATPEQMDEALRRFAELVREEEQNL